MSADVSKKVIHVLVGEDRFKEDNRSVFGLIPVSTKVSAKDTGGALYLFEHTNMGKGGPPRHLHHDQEEWFYVIRGAFAMEIGDDKFHLKPGDSLLAPRKIPHAWACVSDEPGTLLIALRPAGTFETFMQEASKLTGPPSQEEAERLFSAHGMQVLGPPLSVD